MTNETHILTREDLNKLTVFLNSNKLPEELPPYAAAVALCLGTGARISLVLEMRNCDLFAEGKPLQKVSYFRRWQGVNWKISVSFPWIELGKPVRRWYTARKRNNSQALFLDQIPADKCPVNLKRIAALAGIEPEKVNFETLRLTALYHRFREAFEMGEDLLQGMKRHTSALKTLHSCWPLLQKLTNEPVMRKLMEDWYNER